MYCLRVNVTSPRQIPMHILMSLANNLPCSLVTEGGTILGQPLLFECMGFCVLSPAHESEMRGYLVYLLIVKYVSHRFCLNSARVY